MTFWGYYREVFKRGFGGSWGLAERIELTLGVAAGALQFFYPPARYPIVGRVLGILWIVPAALLVFTFGRRLLFAPYDLHAELERAPGGRNAALRARLTALLSVGEQLHSNALDTYRNSSFTVLEDAQKWELEVKQFCDASLDAIFFSRFRHGAPFPQTNEFLRLEDEHLLEESLRQRCETLLAMIKEFS